MSIKARLQMRERQESSNVGASCSVCLGPRIVTLEGRSQSFAQRCPGCFPGLCDKCGGERFFFEDDWSGAAIAKPCECVGIDERIALYNAVRLPQRYFAAGLTNLPSGALNERGQSVPVGSEEVNKSFKDAKLSLVRSSAGFKPGDRGVGLIGPVGCGKTHLMAALTRELTLQNGVACRFVEFTHLLSELRESYEQQEGSAKLIAAVVEVPVLIIDELGKGLSTEWQFTVLDELISRRYNARVTTFFTSNYVIEKQGHGAPDTRERFNVTTLEDRIGGRMYSRIREMCDIYTIDAPDYRKRERPAGVR